MTDLLQQQQQQQQKQQQEAEYSRVFCLFFNSKIVEGYITVFWLKLMPNVADGGCVPSLQEITLQHELHFASFLSVDRVAHSAPREFFFVKFSTSWLAIQFYSAAFRVGPVKNFLNRFDIKPNIRPDRCTRLSPLGVARLSQLD